MYYLIESTLRQCSDKEIMGGSADNAQKIIHEDMTLLTVVTTSLLFFKKKKWL